MTKLREWKAEQEKLPLSLYRVLPYVLISAGMQIAIALWVPVERSVQRDYRRDGASPYVSLGASPRACCST